MLLLKTPAKINLFLNLKHPRPDGFHEVCFLMQAVALWDTLQITPMPQTTELRFTCHHPNLSEDPMQNLVIQAYQAFFQEVKHPPIGLTVHLNKQIPIQAGLGGGSSDAAAMLLALNHLTHAALPLFRLQELGAALGSDVPFFLTGGSAMATGRGEVIQPLALQLPPLPLLIVKPKAFGISTPLAYQAVRNANRYQTIPPEPFLQALHSAKSAQDLEPYLYNDFEAVLFPQYPELQKIQSNMQRLGIQRPMLCGSGPSMAGFWEPTPQHQALCRELFPAEDYDVFPTHLLSGGITGLA